MEEALNGSLYFQDLESLIDWRNYTAFQPEATSEWWRVFRKLESIFGAKMLRSAMDVEWWQFCDACTGDKET